MRVYDIAQPLVVAATNEKTNFTVSQKMKRNNSFKTVTHRATGSTAFIDQQISEIVSAKLELVLIIGTDRIDGIEKHLRFVDISTITQEWDEWDAH